MAGLMSFAEAEVWHPNWPNRAALVLSAPVLRRIPRFELEANTNQHVLCGLWEQSISRISPRDDLAPINCCTSSRQPDPFTRCEIFRSGDEWLYHLLVQ